MDVKQFVKERDAALLSLDREIIEAFAKKWQVVLPKDSEVFWAAIHKARTGAVNLPREARLESKLWLLGKGLHALDDGDL